MTDNSWLDQIQWNADGLVPVVTQDAYTHRILTHAWLNRDALDASHTEGRAVYWSRSRQKLWRKGEESGNVQWIQEILLDCDADTVCFLVEQIGGIACHTGRESCFYRKLAKIDNTLQWHITDPVIKDPTQMYRKTGHN
jgi:phosphoribosyl-AMP cyclohydrolase